MAISDNDLPGNDGLDVYTSGGGKPALRLVFLLAAKGKKKGKRKILGKHLGVLSKSLVESFSRDGFAGAGACVGVFHSGSDNGENTAKTLEDDFLETGLSTVHVDESSVLNGFNRSAPFTQIPMPTSSPPVRSCVFVVDDESGCGADLRRHSEVVLGSCEPLRDLFDLRGIVLDVYRFDRQSRKSLPLQMQAFMDAVYAWRRREQDAYSKLGVEMTIRRLVDVLDVS